MIASDSRRTPVIAMLILQSGIAISSLGLDATVYVSSDTALSCYTSCPTASGNPQIIIFKTSQTSGSPALYLVGHGTADASWERFKFTMDGEEREGLGYILSPLLPQSSLCRTPYPGGAMQRDTPFRRFVMIAGPGRATCILW